MKIHKTKPIREIQWSRGRYLGSVALLRETHQRESLLVAFRTVVANLFNRRSRLGLILFTIGMLVGKKLTGVDTDIYRVTTLQLEANRGRTSDV